MHCLEPQSYRKFERVGGKLAGVLELGYMMLILGILIYDCNIKIQQSRTIIANYILKLI